MSIVNLYSVRDLKITSFNSIICCINDLVATRILQSSVNNRQDNSMLTDYPADYDLFHLGSFDTDSGLITPCQPRHICSAASLVILVQKTSPAPVAVPPQAERRGQRGPRVDRSVEQTSLPISGGK